MPNLTLSRNISPLVPKAKASTRMPETSRASPLSTHRAGTSAVLCSHLTTATLKQFCADRQEITTCHESMLQAASRSWVHASCGFLLCLQQHSCNTISNQPRGFPAQRDFCIVLLFLSQGATCWWSLLSSQLRQRENRAPVIVAVEPSDVQECGHISMAFNAVTALANATKQAAKGSTRDQSLSQTGAGGGCQPCHPSAIPSRSQCTSLTLVLLAVDRKWKETENWRLSLLLQHSSSSSPSCLVPPAQITSSARCWNLPHPGAGQSCCPGGSHSCSCPESLSRCLGGK